MKRASIELTREKLLRVISAATVFIVLLIYFALYAPLINELKIKYLESKSSENRVLDARNIIESLDKMQGERIPTTEGDVGFVIDELTRHGKLIGIKFISIRPREIIDKKGSEYKILPIEMEIESSYEQVSTFLGSLDELKKGVIKVKSFNIVPNKEAPAKLAIRLTAEIYLSELEDAR